MRLYWTRLFEKVGDELQEKFVEYDHGFVKKGKLYVFCRGCQRWVERRDYLEFCQAGMHEYSKEADLEKAVIPEEVEKLSDTQI